MEDKPAPQEKEQNNTPLKTKRKNKKENLYLVVSGMQAVFLFFCKGPSSIVSTSKFGLIINCCAVEIG